MPIKRYSKLLKDIRKTRHLTQENFADGIYSPVSLSRIENGKSGMKKDNFELLMKKHNIDKHIYPTFVNRDEYKTYLFAQHITDSFMCFDLSAIPSLLLHSRGLNFKGIAYHQLHLTTYAFLMLRTGSLEFDKISAGLYRVLNLYYDNFDWNNLELYMPNNNLLFCMAGICECYIHTNNVSLALQYLRRIIDYQDNQDGHCKSKVLNSSYIKFLYSTCLILNGRYDKALDYCTNQIDTIISNRDSNYLHAMYVNMAASYYYLGNTSKASYYFDNAIKSCEDINHWTSNYIMKHCRLYDRFFNDIVALHDFNYEDVLDYNLDYDIVIDTCDNTKRYELGDIIRDTRLQLNYSQEKLCKGVCTNATLSKIEHNEYVPSYFLLETLLERLGIYLDDFTFFISDLEYDFYDFINKIEYLYFNDELEVAKNICVAKEWRFANSIDPIINQRYLYYKHLLFCNTPLEYLDILNMSVPNFSFDKLDNFLLSKFEFECIKGYFTILNTENGRSHINEIQNVVNYFFSLDYNNPTYNPRLKYRIFSNPIYNFINYLVFYDYVTEVNAYFDKVMRYLKLRGQLKLISYMACKHCTISLFFEQQVDLDKRYNILRCHSTLSKEYQLLDVFEKEKKSVGL